MPAKIEGYPGGQTLPSPQGIDFTPGELLGSVSGELGLREFLESRGHTLVVTSDKEGPDSVLDRELPDADVVISQGGWNIADCVSHSYDLEGMDVGVIAASRIGVAVLRRLKPFDVKLHHTDKRRLPKEVEEELNLTFHETAQDLAKNVDVVSIHAPLHPETLNLFDEKLLISMRKGSYIVNTARAQIVDRDAVVRALESGQLGGYAGDVWYPQPAPADPPGGPCPSTA